MRFKNNGMPPGGIRFVDPRVPAMRWLDDHTTLTERIKEVIRFRLNNPTVYDQVKDGAAFDMHAVGEEIINYNCSRIGNDPNWCYDEKKSQVNIPAPSVVPEIKVCAACGTQLIPRYCKTCGGNKINGWDCPKCQKSI